VGLARIVILAAPQYKSKPALSLNNVIEIAQLWHVIVTIRKLSRTYNFLENHGVVVTRIHALKLRDMDNFKISPFPRLGLTCSRNRVHLVSLGVTRFHLVSLGFTWCHLDSVSRHSVSLGFTCCHSVSLVVTRFHLVSLGATRFHLVSHGLSKFDLFR
jgi:hypothetical protein